jgi:hypothetical protein
MEGYIQNKLSNWTHALKRSIGPGATIPLDEVYTQYGAKHNLSEGEEFVNWLRDVKLKDTSRWGIVYTGETTTEKSVENEETKKAVEESEDVRKRRMGMVAPPVSTSNSVKVMEIADIVELSVRRAREVVTSITDIKLLKYALQEANQRAGKDSLCLVLRRRIKDLELYRTM